MTCNFQFFIGGTFTPPLLHDLDLDVAAVAHTASRAPNVGETSSASAGATGGVAVLEPVVTLAGYLGGLMPSTFSTDVPIKGSGAGGAAHERMLV